MDKKPITASELPELGVRFRIAWLRQWIAVAFLVACGFAFWKSTATETIFGVASGTMRSLVAVGFLVSLAYSFWNWRCPRCRSLLKTYYWSAHCSRCELDYSIFDGAERVGDCETVDSWKSPQRGDNDVE